MARKIAFQACLVVAALGAALILAAGPLAAESQAQNVGWPQYGGGDSSNTHYSPLAQIKPNNIKHLHVAYAFSLGALRSNESTPLVIGNTMYVSSSWGPRFVYALDAATGALKWRYQSRIPESIIQYACCDVANRGVTYADGKVLVGQLDGKLVALDAQTGKPVWKATVIDYKLGAVITSPPLVAGNKVITGFGGAEFGVRGYLSAYDLATGKPLWRTYTVPGPGEPGIKTWKDDSWKHGGAVSWLVGSYDPKLNIVYFGTSNPGPWEAAERSGNAPGDKYTNLYSCSVIALDPETGKMLWHVQYTPDDAWDYDGVNESVLADLTIDGKKVPVLLHADRNGFFYTANRKTGRVISARAFVYMNWAKGWNLETERPIENPGRRPTLTKETDVCPSMLGGKNWQPMSYDPETGLVYIPAENLCVHAKDEKTDYHKGMMYLGINPAILYPGPGGYQGALVAWNPITQSEVWKVKEPMWFVGGVLSTGGGLAFYGTLDGWFKAVDARTGSVLWKFRAGSGVNAAPITYEIGGRQYIAVVSGRSVTMPNWLGKFGEEASRATPESGMLFVFALDQ
ncbi:MAG TPA: PQQ-dependent dehydrogenase, methanol/ethanol family [Candidatus Binataceae bacterium]|nr:PQQ-dependent dehydrogenase, methanol/ethanol family [Candidatus Binataceae bacterium]